MKTLLIWLLCSFFLTSLFVSGMVLGYDVGLEEGYEQGVEECIEYTHSMGYCS